MCLAVPGRVLDVEGTSLERRARVDFGGVIREVNLAFVPEAAVGDFVIVHAGVAIARLNEAAAARTLADIAALGDIDREPER